MSMERWNPFRDIEMMRQAMDRWFDDRPVSGYPTTSQTASVAIDLHETENGYELNASLPGVRPEDIDININRDTLTLRGKSEQSSERQQGNYIHRERHSGSFQRVIRLPEPINTEQVEATLNNGVLKMILPRLQQTPSRRVQVRGGTSGQPSQPPSQAAQHSNQVNVMSGQQNSPANTTGSTAETSKQDSTMQRPEVMANLSSTELGSLENHANNNDEHGFHSLAQSYGWEQQTIDQVWRFLKHRVSNAEVQAAFGGQSGQAQ